MKIVSLALIGLLLLSCSGSSGKGHSWPKTDAGKSRLHGQVRSVDEIEYDVDEKGNKENVVRRTINRFDAKGTLVESIDTGFMSSTAARDVYIYNDHGKMIEKDGYFGDTIIQKIVISYSSGGKRSRSTGYKDGILASHTVAIYDSRGNQVIDSIFNSHDSLLSRSVSTYDNNDNPLTDSTFDVDNKLTNASKHVYDNNGNDVDWDTFNPASNTHMIFKHQYDESGQETGRTTYFKNRIASKYTLKYDKRDKAGNWLTQTEYSSGKPEFIIVRVISYW